MVGQRICALLALGTLMVQPTWAYKIRPAPISGKNLRQRHQGWLADIAPVHEKLAKMALACAQANPSGAFPCTLQDVTWDNTDGEHPLVKGVRWNDDPNNLFEGGHPFEWAFWLTDAKDKMKAGTLERTNYLTYRSHFLDLQFLHAMSMRGQSPTKVQKDILDWCRFAYDVATGVISPDETLLDLRSRYDFARQFEATGPVYWSVRKLFTNIGERKYNKLLEGVTDREIQWRAAGALLHTIQDSYSTAHVDRESSGNPDGLRMGPVRAFLDYTRQDHKCHGEADHEPDWANQEAGLGDGPIYQGAWVLRRILNRQAWDDEAEARFRTGIFPLSAAARKPDGGSCALR